MQILFREEFEPQETKLNIKTVFHASFLKSIISEFIFASSDPLPTPKGFCLGKESSDDHSFYFQGSTSFIDSGFLEVNTPVLNFEK